ncbi:MAG: hydrogenase expression/formation protein HypE [Planctomycetes bacterium]|jgi:hydrogenase expression/formation protein HypE|nr:hydrogenase expression/formation protein HypE [Planctomycetota bacterium]
MTNEPERVLLAHGGGGRLQNQLIHDRILPRLRNDVLAEMADAAHLQLSSNAVCFTTDSYVVKPLFFRGGDIGKLAVCGTVNDLAVSGSRPVALSLALIIEEGFEFALLDRILQSIGAAAARNGVSIVTGDTKTVDHGSADGLFINTAGIGIRLPNVELGLSRIEVGDRILLSGSIGDHGMTIVSQREGISFESPLASDCAGLAEVTCTLFENVPGIKFMRDPTRGGLAATLNEVVEGSRRSVEIEEQALPVKPTVQAAAEMLGFDVLNAANEGKFVAIVSPAAAPEALRLCREHPLGRDAALIGTIVETRDVPLVELKTRIGGRRIVPMPYGRELPRIC